LPKRPTQTLTGHHATGGAHQGFENDVFRRRQLQGRTVNPGVSRSRIDAHRPNFDWAVHAGRRSVPAKNRLYAGDELLEMAIEAYAIVGAHLKRGDPIARPGLRQHYDGDVTTRADQPQGLETVEVLQRRV